MDNEQKLFSSSGRRCRAVAVWRRSSPRVGPLLLGRVCCRASRTGGGLYNSIGAAQWRAITIWISYGWGKESNAPREKCLCKQIRVCACRWKQPNRIEFNYTRVYVQIVTGKIIIGYPQVFACLRGRFGMFAVVTGARVENVYFGNTLCAAFKKTAF